MKVNFFLVLLLFCLLLVLKMDFSIVSEKEGKENPLAPDEWFSLQRIWPYHYIDNQAVREAREYARLAKQNQPKQSLTADWIYAGPKGVYAGRVTDIEMPEGSNSTVYVAAASGGVFKSYNLGSTWFPVFDDQSALSVGDIAISPADTNVIFVGTGEPNGGGGSLAYDGDGIFRSMDGGNTWQNTGLNDCGSTGKIAIDPVNPNRIYVAMMGTLFSNSSNRGIYRSLDGGDTWQQSLFVSDSTGGIDVVIDPLHPDTIYASLWERVRRPNHNAHGGPTSAIYRSTDGGSTWSKLNSLLPFQNKGRINLAINPLNPAILYASVVNPNGTLNDIFKSSNFGNAWMAIHTAGEFIHTSFDWWFGGIKVDPHDPSNVYMLLINTYRSTNSGQSWNVIAPFIHVDHHALYFMTQPGHMILGNDGGVNFTTNYFQTYTENYQQNLPIAQLYAMDVACWDSSYLIIGAQDNNVFRKSFILGNQWQKVLGGDGVNCRINQLDPTKGLYMSSQYGGFYFTSNTNNGYYPTGFLNNERFNWKAPIMPSPSVASNVYVGGTHVYKSINQGHNFFVISPVLSNNNTGNNLAFGTVTTIAVSASNENYLYAGTDDGNLWKTVNGGTNWISIKYGLPNRWVTSIKVHPNDPGHVWVTYSGYRYGENISHVYESLNGGENWTSISGNLPDVPVNDILIDTLAAGLYYLATDVGVFITQDGGNNWLLVGQAMPTLPVSELCMHYPTHTLFAATYGRGLFKIDAGQYSGIENVSKPIYTLVYPNPFSSQFSLNLTAGKAGNCQVTLYDAQGKKYNSALFYVNPGVLNRQLNIPPGPAGLYYLLITLAGEQQMIKVLRSQ